MIVKVQLPQFTTESDPPILVYDRTKKYMRMFPASQFSGPVVEEMRAAGKPKAYYDVTLSDEMITFNKMVRDQPW
jgi:hypothetical protein